MTQPSLDEVLDRLRKQLAQPHYLKARDEHWAALKVGDLRAILSYFDDIDTFRKTLG